MKIFKFGGASVKDAVGVRNVATILKLYQNEPLVVVISAIGKSTNLLERITAAYIGRSAELAEYVATLRDNHLSIARQLSDNQHITDALEPIFQSLDRALQQPISGDYDFEYDRIVSFGELLSTTLVSAFLNEIGVANSWLDVRELIKTDANFREGKVDWAVSQALIGERVAATFAARRGDVIVTQGFIGGTVDGFTTTLGREGSDYSAAILAYSLDAESVTIWKDVPGLLNADPKFFPDAVKLAEIPYEEAIELSYYGASIIHPKTLKPLQNKQIPLFVKPFLEPTASGSVITACEPKNDIPSYIFKRDQILITIFPKDFSFIAVDNLSEIFAIFSDNKLKINIMQNSALSFSVCVDYKEERVNAALAALSKHYKIKYNTDVELITIRHYTPELADRVVKNRKIYVEQKNRTTLQLVVRGKN